MIKSFITSFKLKNTYRVNSVIYAIREFPFIKKILPTSLYQNKTLKIIGNIISALIELGGIFLGKFLYILLCIVMMNAAYKTPANNTFLHIFFFLTLAGSFINTYMFNPTKDKYYAMMILNMDAKKYTLSNYYYTLLKTVFGFLPFTIIFGLSVNIPLWICFIMPIFVITAKMTVSAHHLLKFKKTKKIINENNLTKKDWLLLFFLILAAYGLPFLSITITPTIFLVFTILTCITGIISLSIIQNFNQYKKAYKQVLTIDNVYAVQNATSAQAIKETISKQIELDTTFVSKKKGFAYFHELFIKRHRKILTDAIKKQSYIIIGIGIILSLILLKNQEFSKKINELILVFLPYFVFIMYILNRGTTLTQAMFMNCDHSMLTYRFYRSPKVILGIFKERLKTLIAINVVPAFLIGSLLCFLLYMTGGTNNPWNYIILFFSIIAMSIFFSVHYLVMYYLLQPYTISTEMKSSTYHIVQSLTYFVCYFMIGQRLPLFYFGIATILFSILYSLISLFLVYKYAPKTFKIRI